jgi:phospholipid/cholesterol/gamma-HCH transport system ATP-binding protein
VVRDLHVSYGSKKVLNGVDLELQPREILAIVGGSGSGKSTLLRAMIGALQPQQGEVLIEGLDLNCADRAARATARKRFGVLFQSGALIGSLTVGDNVAMPLRQHTRLDENTIAIMVRMKLAWVGLEGTESLYPAELSGGMRKRAGLARALALDPPLVFCDEPSAGLDPISVGAIDQLLLDLRRTFAIGAIVVTHELPSVLRIADRVVMLHDGKLIFDGTKDAFAASDEPHVAQFRTGSPEGPITAAGHGDMERELVGP